MFNHYFCLIVLSLLLCGTFSFAQSGGYDASKLSSKNQQNVLKMEHYLLSYPESMTEYMQFEALEVKLTPAETAVFVQHPDARIRTFKLDLFSYNCLREKDTASLYSYMLQYINDSSTITARRGCIVYTTDFVSRCYDELYEHLTKEQQRDVYQKVLLSDIPTHIQEELIEKLPQNEASYPILEELVYKKHKIAALKPLLGYRNPKDVSAPFPFMSRNRKDAQWAMFAYFDPSYEHYLETSIPELLSNTWSDDVYYGYSALLEKSSPETQTAMRKTILSSLKDDRAYNCVPYVLYTYRDSIPESERGPFLLKIFPSMDFMDTATVNYLRTNYPVEFEQKLEQRLLLVPDSYEDFQYSDSAYARFILRDYTAAPSAHKTAVYRKLITYSNGPVLIEAVLQLKKTHPQEAAAALEQRHLELVALQSEERSGLPYGLKHGLTLMEALWMEYIQKAIVYLHDDELNKRVANVIVQYLGDPEASTFDKYAHAIILSANDPALYEQLLQKLETRPYEYTFNSIVELLLGLENPAYNQRLKARYQSLQQTPEKENTDRFRQLLEENKVLMINYKRN